MFLTRLLSNLQWSVLRTKRDSLSDRDFFTITFIPGWGLRFNRAQTFMFGNLTSTHGLRNIDRHIMFKVSDRMLNLLVACVLYSLDFRWARTSLNNFLQSLGLLDLSNDWLQIFICLDIKDYRGCRSLYWHFLGLFWAFALARSLWGGSDPCYLSLSWIWRHYRCFFLSLGSLTSFEGLIATFAGFSGLVDLRRLNWL